MRLCSSLRGGQRHGRESLGGEGGHQGPCLGGGAVGAKGGSLGGHMTSGSLFLGGGRGKGGSMREHMTSGGKGGVLGGGHDIRVLVWGWRGVLGGTWDIRVLVSGGGGG